jgi:RHH-type proline utilization regulon transcriptional repressor/proline dehydrogenase/delta 1-pyrroline-5-carboxylate dehydrogenase
VGPTAKAGGANYVNCLRHWHAVSDVDAALGEARAFWHDVATLAIDESGLEAERNLVRYRRHLKPIAVRLDETVTPEALAYLSGLRTLATLELEFSAASPIEGLSGLRVEGIDQFASRVASFDKVRWLSREPATSVAALERGVSIDSRALAQSGAVELSRWLLEQSVSITNHRYGNSHAGPKPRCLGLGETHTAADL